MENTFTKLEEWVDHVKEYLNNRIDSLKLEAAEKSARIITAMMALTVISLMVSCCMIFLGIGLAFLIAKLSGEAYIGFLAVSVLYCLAGWIIWRKRESWILNPVFRIILRYFFKNENGDDEKSE